MNIGGVDSPIK
ncbi:hypothetical protein YPPY16_2150, partial [Yersinia pestis PY-16]